MNRMQHKIRCNRRGDARHDPHHNSENASACSSRRSRGVHCLHLPFLNLWPLSLVPKISLEIGESIVSQRKAGRHRKNACKRRPFELRMGV